MGKSTGLVISYRRTDMIYLNQLGVEPKEFIALVASKYNVQVEAVKRDWGNRKKWMETYLNVEDTRPMVLKTLLEYDITLEETCKLYEEEINPKAKIQLLYLKMKIIGKRYEIMRLLGVFEIVKSDFESKAKEHARNLLEEMFPWMKGNRDLFNSAMALAKSKGWFKIDELKEYEKKFT